ncbi:hypothetical protein SeLEV6574_g05738 [Synchytrium endobioticum]|uniref:Uncharacterized protein n=1 Tax=Synchytrium endobioticum TaxID=286115 RepID=A0A507CSK3_9FUNG|nr:hypothetical protein SeLEV6574_g05738 [Synchytrium endobioticum]
MPPHKKPQPSSTARLPSYEPYQDFICDGNLSQVEAAGGASMEKEIHRKIHGKARHREYERFHDHAVKIALRYQRCHIANLDMSSHLSKDSIALKLDCDWS